MELNFKKPIITRGGNDVVIYECYNGYCNGAWLNETDDRWIPCSWSIPNGFYLSAEYPRDLDLINDEPYKEENIDIL